MATITTFTMILLTTTNAKKHYLFNRPILTAYELTTNYLMITTVFLTMPYTYHQNANIHMTFLIEQLNHEPRLIIDHTMQIISILYCSTLIYATFQQSHHILRTRTTFVTIKLPLQPTHLLISIELFVTALIMLIDLPEIQRGHSNLFMNS